jgi:hypothetical protein
MCMTTWQANNNSKALEREIFREKSMPNDTADLEETHSGGRMNRIVRMMGYETKMELTQREM